MAKKDPRIDAYIEKAAPFAQPVLKHLRKLINQGCPEVTETVKWGMPSIEYKGPFCSFASFKQHAVFGFWKGSLIKDPKNYLQERAAQGGDAMGHLGRITGLKDLPPDKAFLGLLKQAKQLNDEGVKLPPRKVVQKADVIVPDDLKKALAKNKLAGDTFKAFSTSNKREYVEWINEAKTEETRSKRLFTAIGWMSEGKIRNWKYVKK
jgi:uncharacterized protein YdeI (YjbR/CyaY-like superfamily)